MTYEIQDHTGEKILGRFYQDGLSMIKKKDDVFRIDKVISRKTVRGKKMSLVKWKGYSPESDSCEVGYNTKGLKLCILKKDETSH